MFDFLSQLFRGSPQLQETIHQRTQELRDSEARLRAIVETAGDCILTLDNELRILTANPAAERLFGLPPEEMTGRLFSDFVGSPARTWDNQVATGEGKIFGIGDDVVAQRADGTQFPASLSMSKVNLEQGRIFTAIIHDLTRIKKTENALRQSEARLRLVLDQVPAILCATDRDLRVTLFTSSAATGLSGTGITGSSRRFRGEKLGDPDSDLCFLPTEAFERALTGEPGSAEVTFQDRAFQFHVQALRDARNEIQGTVGIGLDVTQRKWTEAALEASSQELQRRNADLTRSNQELDEFANIASHDLKEPLRSIQNLAALLVREDGPQLGQDGRDRLVRLQHLTQHMTQLIDSLLNSSRVGRMEMAVQPTDLNQVVATVLDSLDFVGCEGSARYGAWHPRQQAAAATDPSRGAPTRDAGVEIRVPRRLPTVPCDEARMADVFRNLISNGLKYNDKDRKWIEIGETDPEGAPESIRHELTSHGTPARLFYVRDNGIGIPQKDWGAIFRIFKRLHPRDKFGGGTGIGLTIVKKIIERHGGQILLDSTPGEGTTFYFTLPEREAPLAA